MSSASRLLHLRKSVGVFHGGTCARKPENGVLRVLEGVRCVLWLPGFRSGRVGPAERITAQSNSTSCVESSAMSSRRRNKGNDVPRAHAGCWQPAEGLASRLKTGRDEFRSVAFASVTDVTMSYRGYGPSGIRDGGALFWGAPAACGEGCAPMPHTRMRAGTQAH